MEAEQCLNERRLSGAVGAEQANGFSGSRNAEAAGDSLQDLPPPQFYTERIDLDDRTYLHGSPLPNLCRTTVLRGPDFPVPAPKFIIVSSIRLVNRVREATWIRSVSPLKVIKEGSRMARNFFNWGDGVIDEI